MKRGKIKKKNESLTRVVLCTEQKKKRKKKSYPLPEWEHC